mmetsp:Transcript_15431/g.21993  ORF Transcript_15431/g.21993 Transcript_15431/m.21993 type:complete len:242 (-) Transcript_15431:2611-3336(-)
MTSPFLFSHIEPQVNSEFHLAVYDASNEALMEARLQALTKDVHKLLAPGESDKFFMDPTIGFIFGRNIRQFVAGNQTMQNNISPSSAQQLQRISQMVRSPSVKRTSASVTSRSTRQKPIELSTSTTAMTASYSGVTKTNTTSFSTPTNSFTSSTATTEYSVTVERRFVSIETTLRYQQQQQDEMNVKLDLVDETSMETNVLLKQMMEEMKITPALRGTKRGNPTDDDSNHDAGMEIQKLLP